MVSDIDSAAIFAVRKNFNATEDCSGTPSMVTEFRFRSGATTTADATTSCKWLPDGYEVEVRVDGGTWELDTFNKGPQVVLDSGDCLWIATYAGFVARKDTGNTPAGTYFGAPTCTWTGPGQSVQDEVSIVLS
jgi:hypothetical protein